MSGERERERGRGADEETVGNGPLSRGNPVTADSQSVRPQYIFQLPGGMISKSLGIVELEKRVDKMTPNNR